MEKDIMKEKTKPQQRASSKTQEKRSVEPPTADEQEEEDRSLRRDPTYLKFLYKVSDYIREDPAWPPQGVIPKDAHNVYSYATCLCHAKDRLIESIASKEPNFLSEEEKKYLEEDEFLTFEDDLIDTLFSSIFERLGQSLENRLSKK